MATEIPKLLEVLGAGEQVRQARKGTRDNSLGIVAVTDWRLILIDTEWRSRPIDQIPLAEVASVAADGNRLSIHLKSGRIVTADRVENVDGFAAAIRETAATATPQPQAPSDPLVLDQLAKLGELRDAGVLTAGEFEAKKAQLLDRL